MPLTLLRLPSLIIEAGARGVSTTIGVFPRPSRKWIIKLGFKLGRLATGLLRDAIDHNSALYGKLAGFFSPQYMKAKQEGIFTVRFSVVRLDRIGIEIEVCGDVKKVEKELWTPLKYFSEEFSKSESVEEWAGLAKKLFNDLVGSGCIKVTEEEGSEKFQQVLFEELLHQKMLQGTSLGEIVNAISWEERFLLTGLLERTHRALGELFPRSPERDEKWMKGLPDHEIEEVLEEARNRLERELVRNEALKMWLVDTFKELYSRQYFKQLFYPYAVLPFIEVPAWAILNKLELMDEEEVSYRIASYFGFDKSREKLAHETYEIARKMKVKDILAAVRKSLNLPMEDVRKCLELRGIESIRQFEEEIFERFKKVAYGRDVEVYGGGASWLRLLRIFKMKDLVDIFSDILSEEPEVVRCIVSLMPRFARPEVLEKPAIALTCKELTIIYDPLTMERGPEICGGLIVRRTGRKLGGLEDIVGSTPLVLRGYLLLRHYMYMRDEDLLDFAKRHVGGDVAFTPEWENTWDEYIKYMEKELSYVDFLEKDKVENFNPSYAIDNICGVIYSFAKLGEKATRLAGLHGVYEI